MEPIHFTSLYERYAPDVLRFARYLTGNPDWADEILSETFLRAWTTRESLRMASAKGYLIAIARNLVTDRFRKEKFEAPLDFDTRSRDDKPDTKRMLDQTILAIQQLEDKYRTPLVMHAISELPYDEIARCLDLPVGTVKVRVHRARLQLNQILNPNQEPTHEATR
jgi:RNA polymerase sigma-70 factor (ECF subfamily)